MSTLDLALLALATWRIAHLLSHEDGPYDFAKSLRLRSGARHSLTGWTGTGFWSKLLTCPLCLSIWIGAWLFVLWGYTPWLDNLIIVLAISGAASLLELAIRR